MRNFEQKISELAENLVHEGKISSDQLDVARESSRNLGQNLANVLVQRGFISETDLYKKMSQASGSTFFSLTGYTPDPEVLKLLSPAQATDTRVFPLFELEDKMTVATSNPYDLEAIDEVALITGKEVDFVVVPDSELEAALKKYYVRKKVQIESADSNDDVVVLRQADEEDLNELDRHLQESQIVEEVNRVLKTAAFLAASDVHIEPTRYDVGVRFRVDGMLENYKTFPKSMHNAMISRIKVMADMDIAEQRLPQDGRVRLLIKDKEIDLRVASYPTLHGEALAVRLLEVHDLKKLGDLGLSEHDQKRFEACVQKPHGLFLVTGPTGSGKSTTLYAALNRIDRKTKHVLSVEDPVEHEIDGVDQMEINPKAGLTFASSIRAIMRQDPDVLLVGEVRDEETAEMSFRAALTGHLVLSSLHTNTAIGAVTRLENLGIDPYLVGTSLLGAMSQRLVRKICGSCKEEVGISEEHKQVLGERAEGLKAYRGKGCRKCRMTGYQGRTGIFELFFVTPTLREALLKDAGEDELGNLLKQSADYKSLLDDGLEKVEQGVTTLEEVFRVAMV